MKAGSLIFAVILLFVARGLAFADRQLDRTEIRQIFQTLTNQPRKTWIPTGTIEAAHQEYRSSNGYTIDSTVTVKYDGDKFYWEINIDSYSKQTEPQGSPHSKSLRGDFDLKWNKRRVFVWDEDRYTMYCGPANDSVVMEYPTDIPVVVNGPLTAGIVPWGHGIYTLESLLVMESSAHVDGQGQVHLTLNNTNMPEIVFLLDPAKDYAVLSCAMNYAGGSYAVKTYGDYELVSGKWVPTTILIERYDNSKQPSELLSYDYWNLTSIRVMSPHPASFRASYEAGATVEFYPPFAEEPLSYRYSNEVDVDLLLEDRLAIVADHTQTKNCATVAVKYVAEQLGKNVTDSNLAGLVNEPNRDTSLYELREFARQLGFHSLAIKTDTHTLRNLKGCQAILHVPGPDHYIVLDRIDNEYVWLIDLDNNKFYYRVELDEFGLDWSDGTALLISNEPLALEGNSAEINDSELHRISGLAGGGFGTFSCNDPIQEYNVQLCSWAPPLIVCSGKYRIWLPRKGCIADPNGGSCIGTKMRGNSWSYCAEDPENPGNCMIDGEWYHQYIRACN